MGTDNLPDAVRRRISLCARCTPHDVRGEWDIFLWSGFYVHHLKDNPKTYELVADGYGMTGLMRAIDNYSGSLKELLVPILDEQTDLPGVFEYEVLEPIGKWIAEHCAEKNGVFPAIEDVLVKAYTDTIVWLTVDSLRSPS